MIPDLEKLTYPFGANQDEFLPFKVAAGYAAVGLDYVEGIVANDSGSSAVVIRDGQGQYNSVETVPILLARYVDLLGRRSVRRRAEAVADAVAREVQVHAQLREEPSGAISLGNQRRVEDPDVLLSVPSEREVAQPGPQEGSVPADVLGAGHLHPGRPGATEGTIENGRMEAQGSPEITKALDSLSSVSLARPAFSLKPRG